MQHSYQGRGVAIKNQVICKILHAMYRAYKTTNQLSTTNDYKKYRRLTYFPPTVNYQLPTTAHTVEVAIVDRGGVSAAAGFKPLPPDRLRAHGRRARSKSEYAIRMHVSFHIWLRICGISDVGSDIDS